MARISRTRILIFALAFAAAACGGGVGGAQSTQSAQTAPVAQSAATAPTAPRQLSVERIYSEPDLNGYLLEDVQWSPDGKQLTFFQASGTGFGAKTELWSVAASDGAKHVLVDAAKISELLPPDTAPASQATGLGRVAAHKYYWSADSSEMVFRSGAKLTWLDLRTMQTKVLAGSKTGGSDASPGDIEDPKFSPDGKFVTFLRDRNIWIANIMNGESHPLTKGGSEELRKGELDWLYPEELDCATAYWWSSDSQHIAFLEMDERPVTQYPIADLTTGGIQNTRYPQAGEANPVVRVGVIGADGGETKWMDTGADKDIYLPRVQWLPDGKSLAIQRLNRAQNKLELLLADSASGKSRVVLTETDPYWINLGAANIEFFADGRRFLWPSERTGFRHLYIYDTDGKMETQLTQGNWAVETSAGFGPGAGAALRLDEKHGFIYFLSNKDNPVELHLFRLSLADKTIRRVTSEAGTDEVSIAPDCGAFMDTFSNVMTPERQDLERMDARPIAPLNENRVPELAAYRLSPVEFLTVKAGDGVELHAYTIKPPNFDASKKYPVLVQVYGGPSIQNVVNKWDDEAFLWHQMMAQKGYIIFALDNRGSLGRGHNFETPVFHHLGRFELADQLSGVAYLKSLPYVDPSRIGIWGWSYGGYMTLNAMFNAPTVFKAGISVSPVSDWRLYDTAYTERYMGRPQDNPDGYRDSSVAAHAKQMRGKLLIAASTGDDNVHFANTGEVLDSFISDGKYPEIMVFPGRGHGISDSAARIALFRRMTQFLLDNL
jgi:dipeptidyl-peptidase-4